MVSRHVTGPTSGRQRVLLLSLGLALLGTCLLLLISAQASALHYRGGSFHAVPTGGNSVRFEGNLNFRSSDPRFFSSAGACVVGQTFFLINGNPPDPNNGNAVYQNGVIHTNGVWLRFDIRSTSCDVGNDVFVGVILDDATLGVGVPYTYPSATDPATGGPWVAYYESGSRLQDLSPNYHLNNGNPWQGWRLETTVVLGPPADNPPIPTVPAVVACSINAVCNIPITYTDADNNEAHTFRFATSQEAICNGPSGAFPEVCPGGTFYQPGPGCALCAAGMSPSSIGLASGLFSWDTTNAPVSPTATDRTYYSVFVVVEDGRDKVPLEFYIQFLPGSPKADFTADPSDPCGPLVVAFDGTASLPGSGGGGPIVQWDWDFGDTSPHGSGITTTHTYASSGARLVTLKVTDAAGNWGAKTLQVNVPPDCQPPPPNNCPEVDAMPSFGVVAGRMVETRIGARDIDGDHLTFQLVGPVPDTVLFGPAGDLVWPTKAADIGQHPFSVAVSDGECTVTTDFTITVVPPPAVPQPVDSDNDGFDDVTDNCPSIANHDQADADGDLVGDACDVTPHGDQGATPPKAPAAARDASDRDADGVPDAVDDCPALANRQQADLDRDGVGDACDADIDGDGIAQEAAAATYVDNCPMMSNADQADRDDDGVGDACSAAASAGALGTAVDAAAPARGSSGGAGGLPTALMVVGPVAVVGLLALALVRRRRK